MSGFSARQVALIVGLVVGLVLGLGYIWGIAPIELVNTYPALLRTDYRWDWGRMTALSYVADGDLARARARLDGLKQEDVAAPPDRAGRSIGCVHPGDAGLPAHAIVARIRPYACSHPYLPYLSTYRGG